MSRKTVDIVGSGVSGLSAAKLLSACGWQVLLYDDNDTPELNLRFKELDDPNIQAYFADLEAIKRIETSLTIVSPGVKLDHPLLTYRRKAGGEVIGELELGSRRCQGRIVSISGSNGKSTTAAWLGSVFEQASGSTFICGNIGVPITQIADQTTSDSLISVEVSSFQLSSIVDFHPVAAILHALTADHIDWHGSFENYIAAKANMWMNQTTHDYLIYNFEDAISRELVKSAKSMLVPFSIEREMHRGASVSDDNLVFRGFGNDMTVAKEAINIPGIHNQMNALAVISAAAVSGISEDKVVQGLRNFQGLPHRLEFVRELDSVKYYNDSKSTSPDSGIWALRAFVDPIILIAGGRGKGADYVVLRELGAKRVKEILLIGEEAAAIRRDLGDLVECTDCGDLQTAVNLAAEKAVKGDIVLLSNCAASFDQFRNFEDRGNQFKAMVNKL